MCLLLNDMYYIYDEYCIHHLIRVCLNSSWCHELAHVLCISTMIFHILELFFQMYKRGKAKLCLTMREQYICFVRNRTCVLFVTIRFTSK